MPIWRTAGNDLVVGTHTITASVSDHGGLPGSASITITSAPPPPITLTTRGYVKGVRRADLTWTGSTSVDVYRNNAPVGTAVPGSSYTDKHRRKRERDLRLQSLSGRQHYELLQYF